MYRRNSDENIRQLERLAARGDIDAEQQLYQARWRIGQCHLHPDQPLLSCDICLTPTQRDFSDPQRIYNHNVAIDLLQRDLGINASVYDVAQWIADRSGPYPQYLGWTISSTFNPIDARLCRRPLPWTNFRGEQMYARTTLDRIDASSDIYGSGVFPQVNQLQDWHQLVRLAESGNPQAFAAPRPTAPQALAYFLATIEENLGPVSWQNLEAIHRPQVTARSFEIYATIDPEEPAVMIGSAHYNIQTMEFVGAEINVQLYD